MLFWTLSTVFVVGCAVLGGLVAAALYDRFASGESL